MSKADDLLRRALKDLEEGLRPIRKVELIDEIRTYLFTHSDDAEEPGNGWQLREVYFEDGEPMMYREPPKPAALEAEPVGYQWLHSGHFRKQIPKNANVIEWYPLYLHPPRPAESEAETIETLKAENFELAAGQCTEGGPWGDEGGTPYCKYAARKPIDHQVVLEKAISWKFKTPDLMSAFVSGVNFAEKHHGIGGDDES